jgi:hypothetical protein
MTVSEDTYWDRAIHCRSVHNSLTLHSFSHRVEVLGLSRILSHTVFLCHNLWCRETSPPSHSIHHQL